MPPLTSCNRRCCDRHGDRRAARPDAGERAAAHLRRPRAGRLSGAGIARYWRNRLWRWSDVLRWTQADSTEDADLVAAVNAALELGARSQVLPRKRRDAIAGLLVKEQSFWLNPSTLAGKQEDHEGVIADLRSDAHEGQHVT